MAVMADSLFPDCQFYKQYEIPCQFLEHQCVLDNFYMSLAQQWQQFAEQISVYWQSCDFFY